MKAARGSQNRAAGSFARNEGSVLSGAVLVVIVSKRRAERGYCADSAVPGEAVSAAKNR